MKAIFLLLLCSCITNVCFSQVGNKLRHVKIRDERNKFGRTIMYGSFISIKGVTGGFIELYNTENNQYYFFDIAPGDKNGSHFRWYVPPGKYVLLKYRWGQWRFEGSIGNADDIYKWGRMANRSRIDETSLEDTNQRYTFYVAPDTVTYVGAWHFEDVKVSFKNEKSSQDSTELYKTVRKKLDITKSLISIPQ